MFNKLPKILCTVLLVLSTNASAGLIDFTGEREGIADEFVFVQDGLTLTISAWTTNVKSSSDKDIDQTVVTPWKKLSGPYGVYKGGTGLGVFSHDKDGYHLDGGRFDEVDDLGELYDLDEGLLFVFSERVDFWGFAADYLSDDDDLNLSYVSFEGSEQIKTTDVFIDREADFNGYDGFPVSGLYGTEFMVWVDGNDDAVRIADTYVTKVPEPDTLFLFSLVLFGLAVQRRT